MVADLPIEVIQEMALDYSPSDIRNLCQTSITYSVVRQSFGE